MPLFLVAICAAALAKSVTIESQGTTVGQLVKEIGRQVGMQIEADPDIDPDRLVVRMNGVSLEDAMKELALQDEGKWIQLAKGWKFQRDQAALEKQLNGEREDRVKGWKHMIERMQALSGAADFNQAAAQKFGTQFDQLVERRNTGDLDDYVRMTEAEYNLPIGRALVRTLAAIGPERLSQWSQGFTEFSSSPGSLQQPIGDAAASILEAYKQEQKVWESAKHKSGRRTHGTEDYDISAATGFIFKLAAHGAGGVGVMTFYDANGYVLADWVSSMGVDGVQALHNESAKATMDEKAADWQPLPHLSRELYRLRDERPRKEEIIAIWNGDKSLQAALNHPEESDPDGLILGQQVLAMARAKKLNVIIPEITTLARFLAETAFKEDMFNVNIIKTRLDPLEMPNSLPNWFLVRKTSAQVGFLEGQGSADPTAIGNFFRSTVVADEVTLDQLASLYVGSKGVYGLGGNFGLIDTVIEALKPDLPGWGWTNSQPMVLSFYGTLTPDQQRTDTGTSIALAALTANNWAPLLLDPWMLEGAITFPTLPKGRTSILTDPFVFFGTTDSRDGVLKLESSSESTVGVNEDGYTFYQDLGEWKKTHNSKPHEKGNHPPTYRPANRRNVKLTFTFTNRAQMILELHCDDPAGPVVNTYDELPKEFREQFPLKVSD